MFGLAVTATAVLGAINQKFLITLTAASLTDCDFLYPRSRMKESMPNYSMFAYLLLLVKLNTL